MSSLTRAQLLFLCIAEEEPEEEPEDDVIEARSGPGGSFPEPPKPLN